MNNTKHELTPTDLMCLDAARGLSLTRNDAGRQNFDMRGLRPSVSDYNRAIKDGIYTGQPITPLGK